VGQQLLDKDGLGEDEVEDESIYEVDPNMVGVAEVAEDGEDG
jgi:hypothetical protein